MKSDSELVDDFVEGLSSGAIESTLRDNRGKYTDRGIQDIGKCMDTIESYRSAKDPDDKKAKASKALTEILHMRIIGVYVNNPSQERLSLMATENEALRRENDELKEQVNGASETIRKLKTELNTGKEMFR